MSVKSDVFGSVRLSGKDADKFVRQFVYGRPRQDAVESASRGLPMAEEFASKGFASIGTIKRKAG